MSNPFEVPIGDEQEANLGPTAEFVSTLLDEAEYFADVENWALEHHGFTAEGVQALVHPETGPINFWHVLEHGLSMRSLAMPCIALMCACRCRCTGRLSLGESVLT